MGPWDLPTDPLEALRAGDPDPFEAFVRSHARVFFAFFRRLGAGTHRAEDLTQDVLLKLYNHAPRYRSEGRFQALALRVARNVWIDDRRRFPLRSASAGTDELPQDDADPTLPEPSERLEVAEDARRLRDAVAKLPESHRVVFELALVEERGYAEIAEMLDIPVGTVKSRMFHAVRKLRHAMGDERSNEEGAA